jgi:hypothetical protein
MGTRILEHIRTSLLEKRSGLTEWLRTTPWEVVREIREDLAVFCEGNPLADDTTVVVCRIT